MKAEITLIGGAAILANYGFRDSTYDVDAIIQASSAMKDAVNRVGDKVGLPNGWLNADFTRTSSYSPKLTTFSTYYKTFSHVLTVRTISGAYLVAMKLMAGRQYKNDISDIVGILQEQENRGQPLTMGQITQAVESFRGAHKPYWSKFWRIAKQENFIRFTESKSGWRKNPCWSLSSNIREPQKRKM